MKTAILPLVLLGFVAGGVGGVLGAGVLGKEAVATDDSTSAIRIERLERQLTDLADQNRELVSRLRDVELGLATQSSTPRTLDVVDTSESPLVDRQELATLADALAQRGDETSEDFNARVAEALSTLRAQEDAERDERRQEARAEALDERIEELTELLGLDNYQALKMREALGDQNEKRDALITEMRESGGWGSMRTKMEELRTDTETQLATFLTGSQLESYQENSNQWRGFGGGFGRRGGDG